MPEMKGVTVKIPADLHAEVKAYIESHNMTMGEFITLAVDNELHPKLELKEDKNMERMRTLAFQVPDSLFQRVKAYLERNHMSQKQFVIGLIEAELEQDEALYQSEQTEEQEDEEESDDQTEDEEAEEEIQEETADEFVPQEAQESPEPQPEEQPAPGRDTAPVEDFEAGSEEVSQEDDGAEKIGEEEDQEAEEVFEDSQNFDGDSLDDVEEVEDNQLGEAQEDEESAGQEDSQDEGEQEDYSYSMSM